MQTRTAAETEKGSLSMSPLRHAPLLPSFAGLTGRIGIFGGTFDPPHLGHLDVAYGALRKHDLERVVFVPAHKNPLKTNAPEVGDDGRLEMLERQLENHPLLSVSPIELAEKPSFTVELLQRIHAETGGKAELFLIIGVDNVRTLHQWKDFEEIARLAAIVPCRRGDAPADFGRSDETLGARLTAELRSRLVETPTAPISATELRSGLHGGCGDSGYLDPKVRELIELRGWYRAAPERADR